MSNGDPLLVGVNQPPDNRATSATVLVHNGSVFGTQTSAFWVQRLGAPVASSAIRGDNFSTGPTQGQTVAGVMGMIPAAPGKIGVLGAAFGQPNILFDEIGVMGVTNTFGVVGKGLSGMVEEGGRIIDSSVGVLGQCDDGIGVEGVATTGFGVIGRSNNRAGVTGSSVSGVGVAARSDNSHGLLAVAQGGVGAFGTSSDGPGVVGQSANGVGVEGTSDSGLAGVHGRSPRRYGVFGESDNGVAILGMAPGNAIQGRSNGPAATSIGVSGFSDVGAGVQGDSTTGIGVAGRSIQGTAGLFVGQVVVLGSLAVTGSKSAVVQHTDGSHRALFCLESAESMLEDFGEVTLTGASIFVKFAGDFAPLIKRSDYQVFLTSYGPDVVYVCRRTRDGFEIARRDIGERHRSVRVGYSIVARRADVAPNRLPKVRMPEATPKVAAPDTRTISRIRAASKRQKVRLEPLPLAPKVTTPDLRRLARTALRYSRATKRKVK